MRLVSIDIDPQDRSQRIHIGPFVAGLNAVWGPRGAGKSTVAKFIRGLLYHRHRDASGFGQEAVDGLVGSLQWADDSGTTRVISSADASQDRDYRFDGPYHFGREFSSRADAAYPSSVASEKPWHRIGGEIFDAVFCGRLGEILPERLWQAARELGIHVTIDTTQDETYRRLKAEEHRLQQRLHHLRVDDRDRAWWTVERQRLATRLQETSLSYNTPASGTPVYSRHAAATPLHAEQSELVRRENELTKQIVSLRHQISQLPSLAYEQIPTHDYFVAGSQSFATNGKTAPQRSTRAYRDSFGTWDGYSVRTPSSTVQHGNSIQNSAPHISPSVAAKSKDEYTTLVSQLGRLEAEHKSIRDRISEISRSLSQNEVVINGQTRLTVDKANAVWEGEELTARLAYADEVLKCWDLYEQTRQRLAEIQSQLRGHGPYHEASHGSFLQTVERYIRELSAGSLRKLPTWALEALRRDLGFAAGLSNNGRAESYREVYRDYRPDIRRHDHPVPPSQSSERQLVELAIRMAIIESASHRVGRLPLILDDALDGFHGQTLDHLVRVLIEFARDGQQILLMTSESEVAQRVRVHHGWVAQLREQIASDVREEAYTYQQAVPLAPAPYVRPWVQPAAYTDLYSNLAEVNAQLASVASDASPFRVTTAHVPVTYRAPEYVAPVAYTPVATNIAAKFFLADRSQIEDAPGMSFSAGHPTPLGQRLRALGFHTVGQLLEADPRWIADHVGLPEATSDAIATRQAEARLMCTVPQLRAFDARVLAGCGIEHPQTLAEMHPGRLLKKVEHFLTTSKGQEILRSGSNYELSRITTWIASARRSLTNRERGTDSLGGRYRARSAQRYRVVEDSSDRGTVRRRVRRDGDRRRDSSFEPAAAREIFTAPAQAFTAESFEQSTSRQARSNRDSTPTRSNSSEIAAKSSSTNRATSVSSTQSTSTITLKFYLDLGSPVVDAPSIGPKMAERLQAQGIHTVDELLHANAQSVASILADKRIDSEVVLEWQRQATLVCSVPNLRGHDAQMLVAVGIYTAEQLASANAKSLHQAVATFASSKAGQRVLRGAEGADLQEVQHWIAWAQQSRNLRAA